MVSKDNASDHINRKNSTLKSGLLEYYSSGTSMKKMKRLGNNQTNMATKIYIKTVQMIM